MNRPLISIILPIYNIEQYLARCMEAVLGQTYENLEVLMVDDGSPDNCPAMCDAYAAKDPRVKALHKKNGGLSDARNYGIEHAEGEYIACIDPDDYVDSDYIEYLYSLIEKYGTRMSICQHMTEFDNGSVRDYGSEGDEIFIGRDFEKTQSYSEHVAAAIDEEIKAIIDSCYAEAREIITEHRDVLDRCAELLLEKEKIGREEFEALFEE